jgi:hypothetical protein
MMEKQRLKFKVLLGLLGLGIVSAFAFWVIVKRPGVSAGALDEFAQCLSQKGITMFGAYWCPHCQDEKRAFGNSFRFIRYVECTAEPQRCLDAGINGYPTWMLDGGRKLEGKQGVNKLSRESGCPLPR